MSQSNDPDRDKVLSEYFDKKDELIMIKNLDIFKASDAFLVLIIVYNVILAFANMSPVYYVAYGYNVIYLHHNLDKWSFGVCSTPLV